MGEDWTGAFPVEDALEMVLMFDGTGEITYANAAARSRLGYAPEGAEVYLDGNYVGISPCSFKKVAGVHVLILRKSGFETKSVTIQLDDSDKDMSYSFADLTPQKPSAGTGSGNSSSN